jgi:hypothetical protein
MDTSQNVSAQLYFKELPNDPNSGRYGCNNKDDGILSTCVNDHDTDTNIENAFQKQLNLSEYYKSPGVFDKIKQDFMDPTMEGSNASVPQEVSTTVVPLTPVSQKTPVGPTDFLDKKINSKSTFGVSSNSSYKWMVMLTVLFALFIIIAFLYLKKK